MGFTLRENNVHKFRRLSGALSLAHQYKRPLAYIFGIYPPANLAKRPSP